MAGRYSNRPDLLEQLRKVVAVLSNSTQDDGTAAKAAAESVVRSRRLRDRFSQDDLQSMIDLYRSGTTAKQVAEKFGVSLRSVKRLLHEHGIRWNTLKLKSNARKEICPFSRCDDQDVAVRFCGVPDSNESTGSGDFDTVAYSSTATAFSP